MRARLRAIDRLTKTTARAHTLEDIYDAALDAVGQALTTSEELADRRRGISQMLLGALAERRFEEISKEIAGEGVLKVEDHRPSRSDTDYRLLDGKDSPICRLNIKFHGSLFRQAKDYVDLEPED